MCSHRKRGDCSRLEGTERCGPNQYGQHEFTAWQQLPSTFHWGECLAQSCLARGIRKFVFWVQKWVLCITCERTRTPVSSWGSYLCSLACSEQIWVTPFTRSIVSKNLLMKCFITTSDGSGTQHEKTSDSSEKPVGLHSLNKGFALECPALCLSQLQQHSHEIFWRSTFVFMLNFRAAFTSNSQPIDLPCSILRAGSLNYCSFCVLRYLNFQLCKVQGMQWCLNKKKICFKCVIFEESQIMFTNNFNK